MSYRRDNRASRTALFDNLDGIEEGGLRASSSYSRDIDEQENEKSLNSLQDRVVFLKRVHPQPCIYKIQMKNFSYCLAKYLQDFLVIENQKL
ncbi:putative BET1-like protein [Helianthus annuus]|nr:putative BET1-like protein [Helianthus annuus]